MGAEEVKRRRREFIRVHHPDRGGDADAFIAGLRAFGAKGQPPLAGPLPRVVVVRRRPWPVRLARAVARWLRPGQRVPRVR